MSQMTSTRQELVEKIIFDIQDQLSILDPTEDSEEFIERFSNALSTEEGAAFIAYLLGISEKEIDTWLEDMDIADDND